MPPPNHPVRGHSLLYRLRRPRLLEARRRVSEQEIRQSVLQNLRRMFSTRRESSLASPQYGIANISDIVHSCPDALHILTESMRETVERYEKRLTQVRVRVISETEDDALLLKLEILGNLQTQDGEKPMIFETDIDASRRVKVDAPQSRRY